MQHLRGFFFPSDKGIELSLFFFFPLCLCLVFLYFFFPLMQKKLELQARAVVTCSEVKKLFSSEAVADGCLHYV